jgi:hypothetical protein
MKSHITQGDRWLFQVLAYLLDAVMHPICVSKQAQACVPRLKELFSKCISLQPVDSGCLSRMGKVLEALGPLLILDPALAPPIIEAFFGLIQCLHALSGNTPLANSDKGSHVRDLRQLTKCYTALASKAPDVLLPYLSGIADRTLRLVQSQVLGDADKNMIFEGLLVSAAAAGLDTFASVLTAVLQQLKDSWVALLSEMSGEMWLLGQALGPISVVEGNVSVGGNDERSRIYYSLQLLVFCVRQANAVPGDIGGQVRTGCAYCCR